MRRRWKMATAAASILMGALMLFPMRFTGHDREAFAAVSEESKSTAFHLSPMHGILVYHSVSNVPNNPLCVSPDLFDQQMKWLFDHHYSTMTASDVLAWRTGSAPASDTLWITFDDGYEDNYTHAYPVLKKYGIHATIFVVINTLNTPHHLTWKQIDEMEKSGLVDIESHTMSHRNLSSLTPEEAWREISLSRTILEKHVNHPVRLFAYPYGDYRNPEVNIPNLVRKAGYRVAVSVDPGYSSMVHNPYTLKRIYVRGTDPISWFKKNFPDPGIR